MIKQKEPPWKSIFVDSWPHLSDTDEAKDIKGKVIKAGDKVKFCLQHLKNQSVVGRIEEKDGILWVRIYEQFVSKTTSILIPPENQVLYKLNNNFINRCYYAEIL